MKNIKVSTEKPPQWILDSVKEQWGVEWDSNVCFTYGDLITCAKGEISEDLFAHENNHTKQQNNFTGGKDAWWKKYLSDEKFRYEQELECYRVQYQWVKKNIKNTQHKFFLLGHYSKSLSSKLYGSMCSERKAMLEIMKTAT